MDMLERIMTVTFDMGNGGDPLSHIIVKAAGERIQLEVGNPVFVVPMHLGERDRPGFAQPGKHL